MSVATFTKSGAKATSPAKLDKQVFGEKVANHELLKRAYVAYLANGRAAAAKTKKRGEVRGGGKKPWRQKGTGRARFGSTRNPIWRGGGITFGPTGEENYSIKVPTATKRKALRQALSLAADENRIIVIEAFENKDGKVKKTADLLRKISAKTPSLMITDNKDAAVTRGTDNLAGLKVINVAYLTVYDLLNANSVIITRPSLEKLSTWLGRKTKPAAKEVTS